MSVLKNPDAVPSRIAGVFRHLLTCKGHQEMYARLELMLSPPSLPTVETKRGRMIREVLNECEDMDLIVVTGDKDNRHVSLHKKALEIYSAQEFIPEQFRNLIFSLIMDQINTKNHDLCLLIAWFLAQNPLTIQGDYNGLTKELRAQVGEDRLELTNETRYDDFRYWSIFLGFAWAHRLPSDSAKTRLVPDPTNYLESQLPNLLGDYTKQDLPVSSFLDKLAAHCPVFQGGFFHEQVVKKARSLPASEPGHIAGSLSLAMLRLKERQLLTLKALPDADRVLLYDGQTTDYYTHVNWHSKNGRSG